MTLENRIDTFIDWLEGDPDYRKQRSVLHPYIVKLCQELVKAERERSALVAERLYEDPVWHPDYRFAANSIAIAIRKGEPPPAPRRQKG